MKLSSMVRNQLVAASRKYLGPVVTGPQRLVRTFGAYLPPPDNRLVVVREIEEDRYFDKLPNLPWVVRSYLVRGTSGNLCQCHGCGDILVESCRHYGTLDEALAVTVAEVLTAAMIHDDVVPSAQA